MIEEELNVRPIYVFTKNNLVINSIFSYTLVIKQREAVSMKRIVLTLAIALGLAFGSFAIFSSDSLACGAGKDKGATTEDTTQTDSGTSES